MKKILKKAVKEGIISEMQADKLYNLSKEESLFKISNLFIYFGGLIAIGSITFFMTLGFLSYGYLGVIVSSLIFGIVFYTVIENIDDIVAKGVSATFVVFLAPLFVYGVLGYLGLWDIKNYTLYYKLINKNFLILEVTTILSAFLMLRKVKYPFLILPIAFALWFMSMDIVELIFGKLTFENRRVISLIFGFYTILLAYYVDKKYQDYSFWLYLFGVMMFWGGLTFAHSNSEIAKFFYFLINIGLLLIGIVLKRRVFLVFGSVGVVVYFGHLSYLFKDSFIFVYVVTFLGVLFILAGVKYKEYEESFREKLLSVKINKNLLLSVLLIWPLIYLAFYIGKFSVQIENNIKKETEKKVYKNSKNSELNDEVIVTVKCNEKIFKVNKIVTTEIVNNIEKKKVIFVYKDIIFNTLNDFKRKYCN
ncbi:MAG: DUF2157 domain-containing protein [Nautiliaceae bacterium]